MLQWFQWSIKSPSAPLWTSPARCYRRSRLSFWGRSSVAETAHLRRAHSRAVCSENILPPAPRISALKTPDETYEAEKWIKEFSARSVPRAAVELSFSRSSGPGGQNVNKVNTKVTARCPIHAPWIPPWAHQVIKASPHYTSSSQTILITSTVHRSQAQNIGDCLSKLHKLVLSASSAPIQKEPSEAQRKRVAEFQRVEKARRRQEKDRRSMIKKSRASGRGGGDWD